MSFPSAFYRWRPHPWHGLDVGPKDLFPEVVHAYIEITPFDMVKYEVDKTSGYLRVDRPHRSSSQPPALYGFVPRTYCGGRVKALSPNSTKGDGDPLDICVISERPINKTEVILNARVLGGMQMIDGGEADDKIIAVLANDNVWGGLKDITEVPKVLTERLHHYFSTYKMVPGHENEITVDLTYGREHALKVIKAACDDYIDMYGG
ncbi:Inorganic diphosphatase [Magnetococcus marinus MC-1]|uniref:inorganic diphosphatase n=1 Tax=Magnetococcus marinus (strain ATCC BAA-1437 / JCM 17883 / MC-1) TaxID=156889 RepID=A0LD75_MAGMM|nr:inorganic pyrophosphatase [Magnetococcus marinus]ABK45918.1 Inorganic diphosphatase [Magnetococcus marinus MC-1]